MLSPFSIHNWTSSPFLHKNKADQASLQSDFSKLYQKIPNMALWNNPIPQNCQISSLANKKKDPFHTKKRGWPGIFAIRFLKIVESSWCPSVSCQVHWFPIDKQPVCFTKNEADQAFFRANHHHSQFLVLVFFRNDGSNSKSHFLNENTNDDGFLASLGANRRCSYFHSVFHILILTIVPESKNWPNPNESYHKLSWLIFLILFNVLANILPT